MSNLDDLDLDDLDFNMELEKVRFKFKLRINISKELMLDDDEFDEIDTPKTTEPGDSQPFVSSDDSPSLSQGDSQPNVTPDNAVSSCDPKKRSIRFRSPLDDRQLGSPRDSWVEFILR